MPYHQEKYATTDEVEKDCGREAVNLKADLPKNDTKELYSLTSSLLAVKWFIRVEKDFMSTK